MSTLMAIIIELWPFIIQFCFNACQHVNNKNISKNNAHVFKKKLMANKNNKWHKFDVMELIGQLMA